MEKKNTKEFIEEAALELFSKKGYQAVSIRDICKVVGIKESTIYYHFANKQAIMDSLLEKVDQMMLVMKSQFNQAFEQVCEVPVEAMCEVAVSFLCNYLLNPFVYKIISVLTIERMHHATAQENYQRIVFEVPLRHQAAVFEQMIARGYIKKNAADVLAEEYYSIVYFSFQKNCIGNELTEEKIQLSREEIKRNIRDIYIKMM